MSTHLPFSNRYVFAKVMQDNPDLCKKVIERILNVEINRIETIEVETEHVSIAHRSVRFDVFLQSDEAAFEVEMQTYEQQSLPQRMRFYRSQLDRRILNKSQDFAELKPVYVIFICLNDPFGKGLPIYTFRSRCDEDATIPFDNGAVDVVLSAQGDLSLTRPEIANLLQFVRTSLATDKDSLTHDLETAMEKAFEDEEWVRSMSWLDWDIRDAKAHAAKEGRAEGLAEGRAEGRAEGLAEGRAEGQTREQDRLARLLTAMENEGCDSGTIIETLKNPDKEAIYKRYGIE